MKKITASLILSVTVLSLLLNACGKSTSKNSGGSQEQTSLWKLQKIDSKGTGVLLDTSENLNIKLQQNCNDLSTSTSNEQQPKEILSESTNCMESFGEPGVSEGNPGSIPSKESNGHYHLISLPEDVHTNMPTIDESLNNKYPIQFLPISYFSEGGVVSDDKLLVSGILNDFMKIQVQGDLLHIVNPSGQTLEFKKY